MIEGEYYLLKTVRDQLRAKMNLTDHQCNCEPDENLPAMTGDMYIAVIPAGTMPGPRHNTSGGVQDSLHSVKVSVFQKLGNVPRDRVRDVFLDRFAGVNKLLANAIAIIDWNYELMLSAGAALQADNPAWQPFEEPLRVGSMDANPRLVTSDTFDGMTDRPAGASSYAAMVRSAVFVRCRRVQVKT